MERLALAAVLLAGCAGAPKHPVQSPRFVAVLDGLDPAESATVRDGLAALGGEGDDKSQAVVLPSALPENFTVRDLCGEVQRWHDKVVAITDEGGMSIAHNAGIEVRLRYTSARADTVSVAVVRIRPEPVGAKLFIDSAVPGLDQHRAPDGSILMNHPEKKPVAFRMAVPFSFIRSHRSIFFRSEHKGVQSYFAFDLDTQTQRKVDKVRTPSEWQAMVK